MDIYQRDVAFPNAYRVTSAMVTHVEKIRTMRSRSMCVLFALVSIRIATRPFKVNRRMGYPDWRRPKLIIQAISIIRREG